LNFFLVAASKKTEPIPDFLANVSKPPPKRPRTMVERKPLKAPIVVVAHPGASYNPDAKSHEVGLDQCGLFKWSPTAPRQRWECGIADSFLCCVQEILSMATEKELARIKKAEDLKRKITPKMPVTKGDDVEAVIYDDEEEEEAEDDGEGKVAAKQPKRKTKAQKRREENAQKLRVEAAKKKEERRQLAEVNRVKAIQKELAKRELEASAVVKPEKEGPGRLGKLPFQELPLEIKLPEEVEGNLRTLKVFIDIWFFFYFYLYFFFVGLVTNSFLADSHSQPEGSLLRDRFASLQSRGLIEPRVPVKFVFPECFFIFFSFFFCISLGRISDVLFYSLSPFQRQETLQAQVCGKAQLPQLQVIRKIIQCTINPCTVTIIHSFCNARRFLSLPTQQPGGRQRPDGTRSSRR
jgi:hypothetical protein